MTNPGDAVGTNGGYGGRTSVNAFNDVLSAFTGRGIVNGWECIPKGGMTVSLGGQDAVRDVAIVENDIGQRTTLDNISTQPVDITLSEAPTLGQRIDVIIGYVTNPPDSNGELVDNPDACGLIAVESVVTNNPTVPDEAMIREAITADGGSGVNAYYVILATIQVGTGMTTITNTEITQGEFAKLRMQNTTAQNPYPVGSIYISANNTNPSKYFGGTWIAFATGRTLVGVDPSDSAFNTVLQEGGEKTHTLTVQEMPSHTHKINMRNSATPGSASASPSTTNGGGQDWQSGDSTPRGGDAPHNNLQPYTTVYMWLRTV